MATAFRDVADLSATTLTSVHTFTAAGTCNISLCNRTASDVTVRVAVIDGAPTAVANGDYLEYGSIIKANGVLQITGVVCEASEQVCAYATATGISVRVHGWEE